MIRHKWILPLMLCFLLGIQDGYIALWKDGVKEPVEVFPFRAEMLPVADQKALAKGIQIESADQFARLMEDYLS